MEGKNYLTFWEGGDGGDRESYSVYYSLIIKADSSDEAKEIYVKKSGFDDDTELSYIGTILIDEKNYIK